MMIIRSIMGVEFYTIGDRLKQLREMEGISQQNLAEQMHFGSRSTVSQFESNTRMITIDVLLAYSRRYKVSADWILRGDEAENGRGYEEEKKVIQAYKHINNPAVRRLALEHIKLMAGLKQ